MGPVRLAAASCAVALTAAGCAPTETAPAGAADRTVATVARISDGDTLRLTNGRKVRLLQIDAPELTADCYGREATRALLSLAPMGTTVELEADPALDERDGYGRLLRYVHVGAVNLNLVLVERGAAVPYFFRKARGRYADELLSAANSARAAHRGFWEACPDAKLNPGLGSVTGPRSHQHG